LILWITYELLEFSFGDLTEAFAHSAASFLICVLLVWSALATVGGLIPHQIWMGKRRLWTDGYLLWRLWTGSEDEVRQFFLNPDWREAFDLLQSGAQNDTNCFARSSTKPGESLEAFREQQTRLASRLIRSRNQ